VSGGRIVRPPEHLVHGLEGPVVIVSGRVAAWLNRHAGLNEYRIDHRGEDPDVDSTLNALRIAELKWREAVTGTKEAAPPEPQREWMSTTQAATQTRIGERAIRKAIDAGRLKAISVNGRWRIRREDLAHYQANRK